MISDVNIHPLAKFMVPAALYAEVHYRIFGLPSRYYMKQPEIVADMPLRIEPGNDLPVLLVVKDAHKFPVTLQKIFLQIENKKSWQPLAEFVLNQAINTPFWSQVFTVPVEKFSGPQKILVHIDYSINGARKTCVADNYRQTPHKAFHVLLDGYCLPRTKNWYFGDLHTHSNLSDDQVEFGAALQDTAQIAKCMGLNFFAATDHSYDLDDNPHNYLVNDTDLPKWKALWQQVEQINQTETNFQIIPGEELSVGNAQHRNVHCLILHNREFFHGSGDGAEKWLQTQPEMQIPQVVNKLQHDAVAIAAHPEVVPSFLEKVLVKRGKWEQADYDAAGLHGVQMWNGDKKHFLEFGLPKWIDLLLSGKKLALFAGTDAHGNFNIFRQIGLPHFKMNVQHKELFAQVRTGLLLDGEVTLAKLMQAIQQHHAIITDGPFASMAFTGGARILHVGDTGLNTDGELQISAHSTPTFGRFKYVRIMTGNYHTASENVFLEIMPIGFDLEYAIKMNHSADYIRLEAQTELDGVFYDCFTNPIYFK